MKKLIVFCCSLLFIEPILAQSPLQYQIHQQGNNNCSGSPVTLTVNTAVSITTDPTPATGVLTNSAMSGGVITNDGGYPITHRGVCWSTSHNPTIADSHTNDGLGLGSFTSSVTGLDTSTQYFLRAYAINSAGTFYGNEISFTTLFAVNLLDHSCGAGNVHTPSVVYGSLTDQEGNLYKTAVIGNQEWMAENLKTSHFLNGDLIPSTNIAWTASPASCWYNNDSATYACPYGKYYNWYAVNDPRKICPQGWHVPTDQNWTTLINFLDPASAGAELNFAGSKLKSRGTFYWYPQNADATDSSGFSGLPSGYISGSSKSLSFGALFWSSTEETNDTPYATDDFIWIRTLYFGGTTALRTQTGKEDRLTVRCIRD